MYARACNVNKPFRRVIYSLQRIGRDFHTVAEARRLYDLSKCNYAIIQEEESIDVGFLRETLIRKHNNADHITGKRLLGYTIDDEEGDIIFEM